MPFQTKEAAYDPLASDEKRFSQSSDGAEDQGDDVGLLGRVRKTPFRSSFWARAGGKVVAAVNTILLLSIVVILFVFHRYEHQCSESECAAKTSYYSPLFEDPGAIEYEYVRFQGALEHQNVYKGTPNKELDEAWEVLIHTNNSGVDGNVIDRIQKSRIAAKYPKEQGGLYYTGIEVFHHMHCLNLIRQYTYKDYYHRPENRPKPFTDSEPVLRAHVDHCIDMLRQSLMCQADVGIVTYNWVHPWGLYPDFSTEHKCRKFDKIVEWADKHALPDDDPEPDSETVWLSGPPQ